MTLRERKFVVPDGELTVALHEDGTVTIDAPIGPELMTVWKLSEAFADALVWHGVERDAALAVYQDFEAHRPI